MTDIEKAELTALKARATELGISYSPNIGLETLKKKIADKEGITYETTEPKVENTSGSNKPKTNAQLASEQKALIRIKLTSLDPADRDKTGEYFTIVNGIVGKITRMIPFNKPWHVEKALLDSIREIKYAAFTQTDPSAPVKIDLISKYSIEVLPPLTPEELKELAKQQQAGNRIDNSSEDRIE